MEYNKLTANMLKVNKLACRGLHDGIGFDFEKPYGIAFYNGKFTVNQIIKIATERGYNNYNDALVILTRDPKSYYSTRFYCVLIDKFGCVNIERKINYRYNIDNFYAKKSFEEHRRKDSADTYIIWQNKEYLKIPIVKTIDYSERFKFKKADYYCEYHGGKRYISTIDVQMLNDSGSMSTIKVSGYTRNYPKFETISQIIDKSGYLIFNRQNELKEKAESLRAQRKKAAFDISDNTDKVKELEKRIAIRKAEIIKNLQEATTYGDFKSVGDMMSHYPNGLIHIVWEYELFKIRVDNKMFDSVTACENEYNSILKKLDGGNNK